MDSILFITPGTLYLTRESSSHVLTAPSYQYTEANDEHVFFAQGHRVAVRGEDISQLTIGGDEQPLYGGQATAELIATYLYANPVPA